MPLKLPPKNASPTRANIKELSDGLTSVIAGHPGSVELWTFYEELDAYLGPWAKKGYLIGYGRYYCRLFNENEKLSKNFQTADWVKRTTVALQEPLRDFVVKRFEERILNGLIDSELRQFAFGVHAKAYTSGGLAMVTLVAPELIPVIVSIPGKEFLPTSPDCVPTVKQVFDTMALVLPMATGISIGALMPVHSGLFRQAASRDAAAQMQELRMVQWLEYGMKTLSSGQMDNVSVLTKFTDRLNRTQFADQGMARRAKELVDAANARKRKVAAYYRKLIEGESELRVQIDRSDAGWSRW